MKSLGASLAVLIGVAGWAAGQLAAPTPPPVPTIPQTDGAPQKVPPLRVKMSAPTSASVYESMPEAQSPIANIRVPTQFGALYNAPNANMGASHPSYLRSGGPPNSDLGCASCATCDPFGRIF